jgi:hypothetical protein
MKANRLKRMSRSIQRKIMLLRHLTAPKRESWAAAGKSFSAAQLIVSEGLPFGIFDFNFGIAAPSVVPDMSARLFQRICMCLDAPAAAFLLVPGQNREFHAATLGKTWQPRNRTLS